MRRTTEFLEKSIIFASSGQVSCSLNDEVVILNLKDGQYYGLDLIGARVWELLQSPKTFQAIQEVLLAEYEVEEDVCRHELLALIQELVSRGLVEVQDGRSE